MSRNGSTRCGGAALTVSLSPRLYVRYLGVESRHPEAAAEVRNAQPGEHSAAVVFRWVRARTTKDHRRNAGIGKRFPNGPPGTPIDGTRRNKRILLLVAAKGQFRQIGGRDRAAENQRSHGRPGSDRSRRSTRRRVFALGWSSPRETAHLAGGAPQSGAAPHARVAARRSTARGRRGPRTTTFLIACTARILHDTTSLLRPLVRFIERCRGGKACVNGLSLLGRGHSIMQASRKTCQFVRRRSAAS